MKFNLSQSKLNPKLLSVLIFIIIFVLINLLRFNSSAFFPNNESYIFLNEFENYKNFETNNFNIFFDILVELEFLFNQNVAIMIVVFFIMLINITLFDDITKIVLKKQNSRLTANIMFIVSNLALSSIINFSYLPLFILFILWTIRFTIKNQNKVFIPIITSVLIDPLLLIINIIISLTINVFIKHKGKLFQTEYEKLNWKKFIKLNVLIPLGVIILLHFNKLILFNKSIFVTKINYIWWIINNTGIFSVSVIMLGLAVFALIYNNKSSLIFFSGSLIILISWINVFLGIISMLIVVLLSAKGYDELKKRKWFVNELRSITLLLIALMIVFYSLNFVETNLRNIPSDEIKSDILKLEAISNKTFCEKKDCELIEFFSDIDTFYSSKNYVSKSFEKQIRNQTITIFENGNIEELEEFVFKNNITSIFLSKDVVLNTWTRSDQGLMLLLTQSGRFNRIDSSDYSIMFKYINNSPQIQE